MLLGLVLSETAPFHRMVSVILADLEQLHKLLDDKLHL